MSGPRKGSPKIKGSGRKAGTPNKTTALLKDAVLLAATKAGQNIDAKSKDALVTYLANQAKVNPGPFMALLGKVLPMQVVGDVEEPINIQINFE
tara:strand:+ start:136 stop:417 length:282 start_codon:yes stop_codon:yes gene_type:complete